VNEPPSNLCRPAGLDSWRVTSDQIDRKALVEFVSRADAYEGEVTTESIRGADNKIYHFHMVQHPVDFWTEDALRARHVAMHILSEHDV